MKKKKRRFSSITMNFIVGEATKEFKLVTNLTKKEISTALDNWTDTTIDLSEESLCDFIQDCDLEYIAYSQRDEELMKKVLQFENKADC